MKNDFVERGSANTEVALGAVQEIAGKVLGDKKMEASGVAHQLEGLARFHAANEPDTAKITAFATRASVLALLSDEENARVAAAEAAGLIVDGDEYLDLQDLERGVQSHWTGTPVGNVLPRKAIREDTWQKVLAHLANRTPTG